MKLIYVILLSILFAVSPFNQVDAAPYGPTIDEVIQKYAAIRNFEKLKLNLSKEKIPIRLGMTKNDVELWAAQSTVYNLTSKNNSKYKFDAKYYEPFGLSFEVWFVKGYVVVIKTYNINNYETDDRDFETLKALKPFRVNECWVRQNYVDQNSYSNGYDFALMIERNISQYEDEPCIGSDRANITLGKPGILYPKHVKPISRQEKNQKNHNKNINMNVDCENKTIITDVPDKI